MKFKKNVLMALGTTGLTVAPIAAVISCGNNNDWNRDDKSIIYDSVTLGDLIEHSEKNELKERGDITTVSQQMSYYFYEQEQKASIEVQKDLLAWNIHQKEESLSNLKPGTDGHDKVKEEIDDLNDKLNKLSGNINYDDSNFSSNYPQIKLPLSKIRENQTNIYKDEFDNFVSSYSTKAEGEAAWIKEIGKRYQGATNKDEAIDSLVYSQVANISNLRNSIGLNSQYTVEQLIWANSTKGAGHFPFLKVAAIKTSDADSGKTGATDTATLNTALAGSYLRVSDFEKEGKVYFYSSNSNLWGWNGASQYKLIDDTRIGEILDDAGLKSGVTNLRLYRHVLLNIRQNPDGRTLPWVASVDLIKSLFSYQPIEANGKQYERIDQIFTGLTKYNDDMNDATKFFLRQVSNNSDSTKTIGGSLGINKASYYSDAMFDGFALGALATEKTGFGSTDDGFYTKLKTAIGNAYAKITNGQTFSDQEKLTDFLNSQKDEDLIRIFGTEIRNELAPTNEKQLVYTDGANGDRLAFISDQEKGGIHLIKKFSIGRSDLSDIVKNELDSVAENGDESKQEYNIKSFISQFTAPLTILRGITDTGAAAGQPATNQDYIDFKKWLIDRVNNGEMTISDDHGNTNDDKVKNILNETHTDLEENRIVKIQQVANKITQGHKNYLVDKFDEREVTKTILTPEEVYALAYEVADKEVL